MGSGYSASSHYIYHCHSWGVENMDGKMDVGVRLEVSSGQRMLQKMKNDGSNHSCQQAILKL